VLCHEDDSFHESHLHNVRLSVEDEKTLLADYLYSTDYQLFVLHNE